MRSMANAVLDLFEAHFGERLPDSLNKSARGSSKHPSKLDVPKVTLRDAPHVLDAVELGAVWHVPHDVEAQ